MGERIFTPTKMDVWSPLVSLKDGPPTTQASKRCWGGFPGFPTKASKVCCKWDLKRDHGPWAKNSQKHSGKTGSAKTSGGSSTWRNPMERPVVEHGRRQDERISPQDGKWISDFGEGSYLHFLCPKCFLEWCYKKMICISATLERILFWAWLIWSQLSIGLSREGSS